MEDDEEYTKNNNLIINHNSKDYRCSTVNDSKPRKAFGGNKKSRLLVKLLIIKL